MGICGQEQDIPKRKKEPPKSTKSIKDKKKEIKNEVIISKEGFHQLDESITSTSKSLCKIVVSSDRMSSGFLIRLFKDTKKFYCLITNEHVITKEMIKEKITIDVYYDSQSEFAKIKLDPEERLIKEFTNLKMDVTVIEIIPKDAIPKDYFLLPCIDYADNYNELINKEISIIAKSIFSLYFIYLSFSSNFIWINSFSYLYFILIIVFDCIIFSSNT